MSEHKMQVIVKSYDKTIIRKEVSVAEGEQLAKQLENGSSLQEFRNGMQEDFFKAHHLSEMSKEGTFAVNVLSRLMRNLDYYYGTEFQKTESIFRAERKERQRIAAEGNEQLDLLGGAGE